MTDKQGGLHIKFVILGEANVGKTSLITRYFMGKFHQFCESTIGCSFSNKAVTIKGDLYKIDAWDTAGQEKYRGLMPMYYRNADVVFICIDLSEERESKLVENYNYWHEQIALHSDNPDRIIILVGTKSDTRYQMLSEIEIRDLIKENNYKYFETSSKTNVGVAELFEYASGEAAEILKTRQLSKPKEVQFNTNVQPKKRYACCGN
jgi:small GTP-binding protein